jgi:hypothetical protein
LATELPQDWILNTTLAGAAPAVCHVNGKAALRQYSNARLREDEALLIGESILTPAKATSLRGRRLDESQIWAALQAADLLRARQELLSVISFDPEETRALTHLAACCLQAAHFQFVDPKPEGPGVECDAVLELLVLVRGLLLPELTDARQALYGDGELARTRTMMEAAGLAPQAPAMFTDFDELGAVNGDPEMAERTVGFQIPLLNAVALNKDSGLAVIREARAAGTYSVPLVHELLHSCQRHTIKLDDLEFGPRALLVSLVEGSTESEALSLVPNRAADYAAYPDERMFVRALAQLCAPEDMTGFMHRLATADDTQLVGMVSSPFADMNGEGANERLCAAHWRYRNILCEVGVYEAEEITLQRALSCLTAVRAQPELTGAELWQWSEQLPELAL